MPRIRRKSNDTVLRAVRPNVGIECAYRKKLHDLIDEMSASIVYLLRACYRANEPNVVDIATDAALDTIAMDALPAEELRRTLQRLRRRWLKRFSEAAPELADYFATAVSKRSDATLRRILEKGGWTVKWTMTQAQRDVLRASINENVALIKSIPQKYLSDVEGLVMRSVQTGRDLGTLTKALRKQFGVTKKRAALIARDQNNKATASLHRARTLELGIKKAIWVHSGAGGEPRPTHVKNSGKTYDVTKGWYDPKEKKWIHPGELINCRCISRPIIEGFT